MIHLDPHRLDTAEHFATSAAHTYGEGHRLGRTMIALVLAEVHVRAGSLAG
ncbi:MAG TPA: hypothetical protein VFO16_19265 [Pseudonocardiaceae bacterium]|nr:hypothetical protein [Pseudonocardiaceae bacterium]